MDDETRVEWMYQAWSQVQQGTTPEPFFEMVAREFNCTVSQAKKRFEYIVQNRTVT